MRRQEAGRDPAASRRASRGGQGVHREMESEGLASNLRAVAEARAMGATVGHERADRAGGFTAEGNTCGACSRNTGVRTARRDREASDLGRSRCVLGEGVHAAGMGPKSRRGRRGDKAESETARRRAARGQGLRSSDELRTRAVGPALVECRALVRSRKASGSGAKGGHREGARG